MAATTATLALAALLKIWLEPSLPAVEPALATAWSGAAGTDGADGVGGGRDRSAPGAGPRRWPSAPTCGPSSWAIRPASLPPWPARRSAREHQPRSPFGPGARCGRRHPSDIPHLDVRRGQPAARDGTPQLRASRTGRGFDDRSPGISAESDYRGCLSRVASVISTSQQPCAALAGDRAAGAALAPTDRPRGADSWAAADAAGSGRRGPCDPFRRVVRSRWPGRRDLQHAEAVDGAGGEVVLGVSRPGSGGVGDAAS